MKFKYSFFIKKYFICLLFLVFLSITFFLYGCERKAGIEPIHIGINPIKTVNPFTATSYEERIISNMLHGSLFNLSQNKMKYIPEIASSFSIKKDSVMIKIRKNIKDQNGDSIDSEYLSTYFSFFSKLKEENNLIEPFDISSLNISYDKDYLMINFQDNEELNSNIKKISSLFVFPVLSPKNFESIQKNFANIYNYATKPVNKNINNFELFSTGIWKLDSINDENIVLSINRARVQNKNFVEKKLVFDIFQNSSEIITQLVNGKIDICFGDSQDNNFLKEFRSIKSYEIDDPQSVYVLLFNYNSPNTFARKLNNDIRFRQLIYEMLYKQFSSFKYISSSFIVKKEKYISGSFKNRISELYSYYNEDENKDNPAEINEKTKEIGTISLYSIVDDEFSNSLSTRIYETLTENGLNFNLFIESLNSIIARIYATNNWDMLVTALPMDYPIFFDPDFFKSNTYDNISWLSKEEIKDENIHKIEKYILKNNILLLENPGDFYKSIDKMVLKSFFYIPLDCKKLYLFARKGIKNIKPQFSGNTWMLDCNNMLDIRR
jgi:hypothetical protein